MGDVVRVAAPAKANLFLRILAREASGFHTLETLFCALSLADEVEVRVGTGAGVTLRVEGDVDTGPPSENLAVRAAEGFLAAAEVERSVDITLRKRIPAGGGLGGGSSDAGAVLRALAHLVPGAVDGETLLRIGGRLGSDVPFFASGAALALAWGRGDRLLALPPLPPRPVLIAHPGVPMPTARAYGLLAAARRGLPEPEARALDLAEVTTWAGVAGLADNDFEAFAGEAIPALGSIRAAMLEGGAVIALLAGSGSSYFGTFEDTSARDGVLAHLQRQGMAAWAADTLARVPAPVDHFPGRE
jgi:4-diphosphocytidyl-2-C-methyl-D-erythritol kinase